MITSTKAQENVGNFTVKNFKTGFTEACASFVYRGYVISISTLGHSLGSTPNDVCIFEQDEKTIVSMLDTVEEAIEEVNFMLQ